MAPGHPATPSAYLGNLNSSRTVKAVKSDNARVVTGMWDKHVSLVLPWDHTTWRDCGTLPSAIGRGGSGETSSHSCVYEIWRGVAGTSEAGTTRASDETSRGALRVAGCIIRGGCQERKQEKSMSPTVKHAQRKANIKSKLVAVTREQEMLRDAKIGCKALENALDSAWWEWSNGSGLLFWRWKSGTEQETAVRDGMTIFVRGDLPGLFGRSRLMEQAKQVDPHRIKDHRISSKAGIHHQARTNPKSHRLL